MHKYNGTAPLENTSENSQGGFGMVWGFRGSIYFSLHSRGGGVSGSCSFYSLAFIGSFFLGFLFGHPCCLSLVLGDGFPSSAGLGGSRLEYACGGGVV